MPITPLHFGVLAPVNHFWPGKVSLVSFTLVNIWIDNRAIEAALTGQPLPAHGEFHTMGVAMIIAVFIACLGVRSMKWALGAFLGAISHILLDALVHPEMVPFEPVIDGNPLYVGGMQTVSLILLPLMIWFIAQTVSSGYSRVANAVRRDPQ